ncbi:hypothetical protein ISS42_00595 [Candidatus Shapirobacteria bacterium]|nr:hypothetical protein [Candidatus Shapirobacteria bacterium]
MFTINNYPKSYANTKPGFYRLQSLQISGVDIEQVESKFWEFIVSLADSKQPRNFFKTYEFVDAGWEWSVFRKDNQTVIKIPAEIFLEVNDKRYLENTEFAYQKILDYFPVKFVAQTSFERSNGLNIMEQDYIVGKDNESIGYNTKNLELLKNIRKFLESALQMLNDYQWLPDFDIRRVFGGFRLRNVIIQKNIPKIVDFTSYYDVYKLCLPRAEIALKNKRGYIVDFLGWISNKKKS